MYNKEAMLTEILDFLKKAPMLSFIDEGIMQIDTGKVKVRYCIEAMKLQQVLTVKFDSKFRELEDNVSYRTLAKFELKDGKLNVIESVSKMEIFSIYIELKEYFINKTCFKLKP